MPESDKKSYPMIAAKVWWGLRERFKRAIPQTVTLSYVATTLRMSEDSARNNVFPALRLCGLIDETGKPTELAFKWRDDIEYKEACNTIIKAVYPQELIDLGTGSREEVKRWFTNQCHVGESAASKMATLFIMLQEANPTKSNGSDEGAARSRKRSTKEPKTIREKTEPPHDEAVPEVLHHDRKPPAGNTPHIHFDIQIHISPESTPDQIDAIFASMAKHLKDLR